MDGLPLTLVLTLAAVAVFLLGTFALALKVGRHSVVDVAWGLGFAVVALVSFVLSAGHGDTTTRVVVTALTVIWGVRLAVHIGLRARGHGEDPRYVTLLSKAKGNPNLYALRSVYLTQGVVLWFVSLPVQVAQFESGPTSPLVWVGATVSLIGFGFEAIGDYQLTRFKADPARKGTVLDTGLWRYTRHPNYFGDAVLWWGLFLIAAGHWPGVLTVLSPILMTLVLAKGTGKPLLERQLGARPGYAEYIRRTSGFIPLPPRP